MLPQWDTEGCLHPKASVDADKIYMVFVGCGGTFLLT